MGWAFNLQQRGVQIKKDYEYISYQFTILYHVDAWHRRYIRQRSKIFVGGNEQGGIHKFTRAIKVAKTAENGTEIAQLFAAGSNAAELRFSIVSGNERGVFLLDAGTGVLTVADARGLVLDRGASPLRSLVVRVSDGTNMHEETLVIEVVDDLLPAVDTELPSSITDRTAILGGDVWNDKGLPVLDRGVVLSTDPNPLVGTARVVSMGTGAGTFSQKVEDLQPGEQYYVRAYASNEHGVSYGQEFSFITVGAIPLPTVETQAASAITETSAILGGWVQENEGLTILDRGIIISVTPDPRLEESRVIAMGSGTGSFEQEVGGLTAETTYYVKAYATSEHGTTYGQELNFTTLQAPLVVPVVDLLSLEAKYRRGAVEIL